MSVSIVVLLQNKIDTEKKNGDLDQSVIRLWPMNLALVDDDDASIWWALEYFYFLKRQQ